MRKITEKDIKVVSTFVGKYPKATTFSIGGIGLTVIAFAVGLFLDNKKEVSK